MKGSRGLKDRSSRPLKQTNRLPLGREAMVLHLRELRLMTQRIALVLGIPKPTVARAHKRNRQSRLPSVEPAEPVMRHEWKRPGDLIHLDMKKQQGRIERPDIVSMGIARCAAPAPAGSTAHLHRRLLQA